MSAQHIIDEHGRTIDTEGGEIIAYTPEPFRILDIHSEEGSVETGQRPDWIGVISAGFRNDQGWPEMSKDGTIYVAPTDRERAKNLVAALAANDNKKLTIAFPYDDLDSIIIQRFARRSATALEVYGDARTLTEIKQAGTRPVTYADGKPKMKDGAPVMEPIFEHVTYPAGSPEYKVLVKTCKAEIHVLFALAEWEGMRPVVKFPDGVGWYALRFTSRNSLQSIAGKLQEISTRMTRGRIAGIPFELSIGYREVAAPDGKKRKVAVWRLDFVPPQMVRLVDSGNLQNLLSAAIDEGRRLRGLPAPEYGIEQAMAEEPDIDLEMGAERAVEILTNGDPPCDVRHWEAQWFAAVKDSRFDADDARADFLERHTAELPGGGFDSLADFLEQATEGQASSLIAAVCDVLDREAQEARRARMGGALSEMRKMQSEMDGRDEHAPEAVERRTERTAYGSNEPDRASQAIADAQAVVIEHEVEVDPAVLALAFVKGAPQETGMVTDPTHVKWTYWRQLEVAAKKAAVVLPSLVLPISEEDLDLQLSEWKAVVVRARGQQKTTATA